MVPVAESSDPQAVERWSFALRALDIPFELTPADDEGERLCFWVATEHAAEAHRALVELDLEEAERPEPAEAEPEAPRHPNAMPWTLAYLWAVVLLSMGGFAGWGWSLRGRVDAELVLAGEWYRLLTAVTLHSDVGHLLSNALLFVVAGSVAISRAGPGVTAAVALAAGAFANVTSVLTHQSDFRSLGASGAVFALVGMVAAMAIQKSRRRGVRRWLPSLGVAVALFAWLGVAPGTDVIAHFVGCAFGFGAGLAVPLAGRFSGAADRRLQQLCGALSCTALILAWSAALLA